MSTYYKHTRAESADVPYSFRCEQCGKESGPLRAVITGPNAVHSSNFKVLTQDESEKLQKTAHKNLVKHIRKIHQDATQKQIFASDFEDICPHCHKPQSWALSGMQNKMFENPIVFMFIGIFISVLTYIYNIVEEMEWGFTPIYWIMLVTIACAVLSLLWNLIKISGKKKATASARQKNLPSIDWNFVRHLLT